jgi:hypothetical protein
LAGQEPSAPEQVELELKHFRHVEFLFEVNQPALPVALLQRPVGSLVVPGFLAPALAVQVDLGWWEQLQASALHFQPWELHVALPVQVPQIVELLSELLGFHLAPLVAELQSEFVAGHMLAEV